MALLPSGSVQSYHLPQNYRSAGRQIVSSTSSRVQSVPDKEHGATRVHFPEYADKEIRRRSFSNWSSNNRAEQSPERFASAGFFHPGTSDRTKCFSCGGGLTNWLPGDDPFVEHARWFPRCNFIRNTKGANFVDNINQTNPRKEQLPQVAATEKDKKQNRMSKLNSSGLDTDSNTTPLYESAKVIVEEKSSKKFNTEDEEREILLAENDRLKKQSLCKVCKSNPVSALYMPCEHLVTCLGCSKSKPNCPLCNTRWTKVIKVFV